jgi:inosine/xanthosine triphosphate pyrophosphatase family protein
MPTIAIHISIPCRENAEAFEVENALKEVAQQFKKKVLQRLQSDSLAPNVLASDDSTIEIRNITGAPIGFLSVELWDV